jgi:hypothetical protein
MTLRVVTVTRGVSKYAEQAVRSVAVAAPGAEYVIVGPVEKLGGIARAHPGAHIVPECGPGLYPNLNVGLRQPSASWDAFTWINDDDLLSAGGFATLLQAMADQPGVEVFFGRVRLIDGNGKRVGELPVARRGEDLAALLARGIVPLAQPGTVIRRSLFDRLGGIDESYRLAGDLDFFVRALMTGARCSFVDAEVAAFRLSAGQLSKQREVGEAEKNRALAPLAATPRSLAALWRFRLGNLGVYAERLRRHGWVSMQSLYDRTE